MTMDSMVRHLESSGFETTKKYDTAQSGYWFRISKDDFHAEKFFKYPADVSPTQRDHQQRDFIDSIIDLWHRNFKESGQKQKVSEKKMILVGRKRDSAGWVFFNNVISALSFRSIDITFIDHDKLRFKTPHTEVWFVDDYYCKYFLDGVRPDAIFGELYPELRARALPHTLISSRERVGLVDYISNVEHDAAREAEGFTRRYLGRPFIFARGNGKSLRCAEEFIDAVFANALRNDLVTTSLIRNPEPKITVDDIKKAIAILKGDNTMPTKNYEYFYGCQNAQPKFPGIKTVHFSGPVTAVIWEDKTKTIVRCKDGEEPDYEKGLAMAIAKKALGTNKSGSNYYDIFKKWLPKPEEE